jgi:BTB/POZ domain
MSDRGANAVPSADEFGSGLVAALADMRIEGLFCDVIISVNGMDITAAHQNILSANSLFFKQKLLNMVRISRLLNIEPFFICITKLMSKCICKYNKFP